MMQKHSAAKQADKPRKRNPELTRKRVLDAAIEEFADKGLSGARVDEIARRAGANKRMLYHYFGNKEDLYLAVMEAAYKKKLEEEIELELSDLDPEEGMARLIRFTWQYYLENPEFITLVNNENMLKARHIAKSHEIKVLHSPLVDLIKDLLRRGEATGVFKTGVDPVQLYITIAALGYYYLSNAYTLSTIFNRNLLAPDQLDARDQHRVDVVLGYLRP
jgi:AcrR family transcriptional regulator